MTKYFKNEKTPIYETFWALFAQIWPHINPALSVFRDYNYLTTCQKPQKTYDPILTKHNMNGWMYIQIEPNSWSLNLVCEQKILLLEHLHF